MGFKDLMQNVIKSRSEEDSVDLPDDVTTDKQLRSLRRQRRVQLEENEKARLKGQIAKFNKERSRKFLFGVGEKGILREGEKMKNFTKIEKEEFMFKSPKNKKQKINIGKMF